MENRLRTFLGSGMWRESDEAQRLYRNHHSQFVDGMVVRYERHSQMYEAFFHLACLLITLRYL